MDNHRKSAVSPLSNQCLAKGFGYIKQPSIKKLNEIHAIHGSNPNLGNMYRQNANSSLVQSCESTVGTYPCEYQSSHGLDINQSTSYGGRENGLCGGIVQPTNCYKYPPNYLPVKDTYTRYTRTASEKIDVSYWNNYPASVSIFLNRAINVQKTLVVKVT